MTFTDLATRGVRTLLPYRLRRALWEVTGNRLRFIRLYRLSLARMFTPRSLWRYTNTMLALLSGAWQTRRVWNKPRDAILETNNICDLKCPLCNTGGLADEFRHVQRGQMTVETFRAALDKLLPEVETVMVHNWGEPLLNKNLYACLAYAHQRGVLTQISTHMNRWTPEIGRKLIEAQLSTLTVSCDGLTQESYGKYRVGGEVAKVIAHTEQMIALKRELGVAYPLIDMQFIVFKHNEHELAEFERFWLERGADQVRFIRMSFVSAKGERLAREALDYVPTHPQYQPQNPFGQLQACSLLYEHVSIDWEGHWYTCCFPSGEHEYRMGHIVQDEFWSVWNGPGYRYCRDLLRRKHRADPSGYRDTMCHDCTGVCPKPDMKLYWR